MDSVDITVPFVGGTCGIPKYIFEILPSNEQRPSLMETIEGASTAAVRQNISGVQNSLQLAVQRGDVAGLGQYIGLPRSRRGDDHESIFMGHQKMAVTTTEHPHVIRDAQIGGGEPIIGGTAVRVRILVEYWRAGTSPEELLQAFPHLTLAQVFDALSYYQDHQGEIDTLIEQNRVDSSLLHESVRRYS